MPDATSISPTAPKPGRQPMSLAASWDGSRQPYNLFVPSAHEAGGPCPLVVVLHGKTASWESWFENTSVCEWAESEGHVVAAPHGRGDWFYLGPGESDVLDVIGEVKRLCRIDEERVYLMGHSMGGWGTWHLACTHPDLFAAIVPMAAWAPMDLLPNAEYLRPLVIHGAEDVPVPPHWSRMAVDRLGDLGIEHRHIEIPGRGHESELISEMLPEIGAWLRGRRRVHRPGRIRLRAHSPLRGKAYHLSIHETGHFPNLASIDCEVADERVSLRTGSVRRFTFDPLESPLAGLREFTVVVDHHEFPAPQHAESQVLLLQRSHRAWMLTPLERTESQAPPSPVIGRLERSPENLARDIAEIIAAGSGSDATVIATDLVAPDLAPGDLTADLVADLFLRPEDRLHQSYMSPRDLTHLADRLRSLPPWWGEYLIVPEMDRMPPDQALLITVPEILVAEGLEMFFPIRVRLREVLHDHVLRTGSLAPSAREAR